MQLETISKARQCATLLTSDLRAAHKAAVQADGMLELLLRDLIGQAVAVENRLADIENVFPCPEGR